MSGDERPPAALSSLTRRHREIWVEVAQALVVIGTVGALGWTGRRVYDEQLAPHVRTIPAATPTVFVDPAAARQQMREVRQVLDHIGSGNYHRQVGEREQAIEDFTRALALDPGNAEARQNLRELGVEPPPAP